MDSLLYTPARNQTDNLVSLRRECIQNQPFMCELCHFAPRTRLVEILFNIVLITVHHPHTQPRLKTYCFQVPNFRFEKIVFN